MPAQGEDRVVAMSQFSWLHNLSPESSTVIMARDENGQGLIQWSQGNILPLAQLSRQVSASVVTEASS